MPPQSESILVKSAYPLGCAIIGGGSVVFGNYHSKRPMWAALHKTIPCTVVGFFVGIGMNYYERWRNAERDAVIRHYIELHPEDFKVEKKKYKHLFEPWHPNR